MDSSDGFCFLAALVQLRGSLEAVKGGTVCRGTVGVHTGGIDEGITGGPLVTEFCPNDPV